ncbi:MAG: helix-turn-helix domain-containing protein [Oscillospiraceae bacterium]
MDKNQICIPCTAMPIILEAGYSISAEPMIHCDRTASFNVAIYVTSGIMEIIEDGSTYTLTADTLFFLKKGVHHWGEKPFEIGTSWFYAHFIADEPRCDAIPMPENNSPVDFKEEVTLPQNMLYCSAETSNAYFQIPKLSYHSPAGEARAAFAKAVAHHNSAHRIEASLELWQVFLAAKSVIKQCNSVVVRLIKQYIDENYNKNYSSAEIENVCGLSYRYAGMLFKRETGLTLNEYRTMLRIDSAQRMLLTTNLTISQIADACGFCDAFYFSRIFTKNCGCPPSSFRKNYVPKI